MQLVFEVPLETASLAMAALGGMPNPAAEVWCAIARLDLEAIKKEVVPADGNKTIETSPASEPEHPVRAHKSWNEMPPSQQAGILTNETAFYHFLRERMGNLFAELPLEEHNKRVIHHLCGVSSRADIKPGTEASERWRHLVSDYRFWSREAEYV